MPTGHDIYVVILPGKNQLDMTAMVLCCLKKPTGHDSYGVVVWKRLTGHDSYGVIVWKRLTGHDSYGVILPEKCQLNMTAMVLCCLEKCQLEMPVTQMFVTPLLFLFTVH